MSTNIRTTRMDAAVEAELRVPADGSRIVVKSADISLRSSAVVKELATTVRQRQSPDSWAEIELEAPSRLFYLAVARPIADRARQTSNRVYIYEYLGNTYLDQPTLALNAAAPPPSPLPVPNLSETHHVFTFPELEGERFLLRLDPPDKSNPFTAAAGDVRCFGPSLPANMEVHLGQEVAYRHRGELAAGDEARSPDVAEVLQRALDAQEAAAAGTGERRVVLTATSERPGTLVLGASARIELIAERFEGGSTSAKLLVAGEQPAAEIGILAPSAGEATSASVHIEAVIEESMIAGELGKEAPATGLDAIGVRISRGPRYRQPFDVAEPYLANAVDLRLVGAAAGTELVVELRAPEQVATGRRILALGDRHPSWYRIDLDPPLALVPETTYELCVSVAGGSVTWLCGRGSERFALTRTDDAAAPAVVLDAVETHPLAGKARLRTRRAPDNPHLTVALLGTGPVNDGAPHAEIALGALVFLGPDRVRAELDLLPALRAVKARAQGLIRLQFRGRSDAAITVLKPRIVHVLAIDSMNTTDP